MTLEVGQPERRNRSYIGNGIVDLFAAPNVATGESMRATRRSIARTASSLPAGNRCMYPQDRYIHVVLDNLSTYRAPPVQRWIVRHPRAEFHFAPTYASWLKSGGTRLRTHNSIPAGARRY